MKSATSYRAAASVLLLRNSPSSKRSIEVLMLERPSAMSFGGSWVFPGGCLESQDKSADLQAKTTGLSDAEAAEQLQVAPHAKSWWLAAIRELYEETGILLAGSSPAVSDAVAGRHALLSGLATFPELAARYGWSFDLSDLQYQSFWIAPDWITPRYATRFFVAAMPEAQTAIPDSAEAVDLQWFQPAEALRQQDQLKLPRPTAENLKLLSGFATVDAALSALQRRDKPATPAVWPEKVAGELTLRHVVQSLEGLNIRLVENTQSASPLAAGAGSDNERE